MKVLAPTAIPITAPLGRDAVEDVVSSEMELAVLVAWVSGTAMAYVEEGVIFASSVYKAC
jgi:hypothetical protein